MFLKEGVIYTSPAVYGRCWLKTIKTTDPGYTHTNPWIYGDFYDLVSETPEYNDNIMNYFTYTPPPGGLTWDISYNYAHNNGGALPTKEQLRFILAR